jgi:dienelactone hydrolase
LLSSPFQEFLTGKKDGKAVTLAGELRIPEPGADKLPAAILLHGSGGLGGTGSPISEWTNELNRLGVATFVVDSFTGRGIVQTGTNQAQLGRLNMIVDAYRAFDLTAKHPRIDPERIALVGFSRGGQSALYASVKRFRVMHWNPSGPEFAAYVAFYPDCVTTYREDTEVSSKPVRVLHGAADDYNPVGPCKAFIERIPKDGRDVALIEYPDAHHVFDGPALKQPVKLPQSTTTRRCRGREEEGGQLVNEESKAPFTFEDPCIEKGPTVAYNEAAHTKARKDVAEIMTAALKLK